MARVTPTAVARWRRALAEDGDGQHLDPTTAQQIAPLLMDEVELLWAELARARAELEQLRETAVGAMIH